MKGEYNIIPINGVNREVLDDQSIDGLCEDIINLRPKGDESQPYWEPISDYNDLQNINGASLNLGTTQIKRAFWQILSDGDTPRRLLLLTQIPGNTPKLELRDLESVSPFAVIRSVDLTAVTSVDFSATRLGDLTVIAISDVGRPHSTYYLKDDNFYKNKMPDLPQVELRFYPKFQSLETIDAGTDVGFPSTFSKPIYLMYRVAYRMYDGTEVKHGPIKLITIPPCLLSTDGFIYHIPCGYLVGYDTIPDDIEFWSKYIKETVIYATNPFLDKKNLGNSPLFYEVLSWSGIEEYPLASDNAFDITNKTWFKYNEFNIDVLVSKGQLGVDNTTNHDLSALLLDTYNGRVMAGSTQSDFAKPYKAINSVSSHGLFNIISITTSTDGLIYNYTLQFAYLSGITSAVITGSGITNLVIDPSDGWKVTFDLSASSILVETCSIEFDILFEANLEDDLRLYKHVWRPASLFEIYPTEYVSDISLSSEPVIPYTTTAIVTIESEGKTFKRIITDDSIKEGIKSTGFRAFLMPELVSYPDYRAKSIDYYLKTPSFVSPELSFQLKKTVKLEQSINGNYSYAYIEDRTISEEYTTGPDFSEDQNDVHLVEPGKVKSSLISNPFVFDAAATYNVSGRTNSVVEGFAVNSIETSQGQFGQYPFYVFTNVGIYALEQTGNPEVAFGRLVPISVYHTVDNRDAFTNADQLVLFANYTGVYALVGNKIDRISDPVYGEEYLTKEFLTECVLGFNKKNEEIIISNPNYIYSVIYNLEYKKWYKHNQSFSGFLYDYPIGYGIVPTLNKIKQLDSDNSGKNVDILLTTKPMNFGNPYIYKKLWRSILRAIICQENQANPSNYIDLDIKVYGKDNDLDAEYELIHVRYNQEKAEDIEILTKYGSVNSFRIELSGKGISPGTKIYHFEANWEKRNKGRVRR